jgi:hypothetical protein
VSLSARQDLRGRGGESAGKQFARGLLLAQQAGEFSEAQVEIFDRAVAIAQAGVEFAFAKREDVGAQLEALLVEFCEAGAVALFEERAALAFFRGLASRGSQRCGLSIPVGGAGRRGLSLISPRGVSTWNRTWGWEGFARIFSLMGKSLSDSPAAPLNYELGHSNAAATNMRPRAG